MTLDLANYEEKAKQAVMAFWGNRAMAQKRKTEAGVVDQGERGAVTAGKNMVGFTALLVDIVRSNGLQNAEIHQKRTLLTLPGYFRPTKVWDLLVMHRRTLVAAIEMKSQVGPSFGKNFNNRTEEVLGSAQDLWTAYREGAFGEQPRPFVGWLMHVEDTLKSQKPINDRSPHFPVLPEFKGASYLKRYDVLCQKLVKEQLYTTAAVITSTRDAVTNGDFGQMSEMTSLKSFLASFAGHIASVASLME